MSQNEVDRFPGERYYNKNLLAIYGFAIWLIVNDKDPSINAFALLVPTFFSIIWTYVAGLTIYFALKPFVGFFFDGNEFDRFTTDYLAWIVPAIGFCLFCYISYR